MDNKKVGLYVAKELAIALAVIGLASLVAIVIGTIKQYLYGNIVESLMTIAVEASIIAYGLGRYVAYRKYKFVKRSKEE